MSKNETTLGVDASVEGVVNVNGSPINGQMVDSLPGNEAQVKKNEAEAVRAKVNGASASKAPPTKPAAKLIYSWGEYDDADFGKYEPIVFETGKGHVAGLVSPPDLGKTTMTLNAMVKAATGQSFLTIVPPGPPRRVLYIDGESSDPQLQADLRVMARELTADQRSLLRTNLFIICDKEIVGEPLNLTDKDHRRAFASQAKLVRPDVIVVDTLSTLLQLEDENSNAEQNRKMWIPLKQLAKAIGSVIVVLHHPGKPREGGSPQGINAPRGGSAAGGAMRALWTLNPVKDFEDAVELKCEKAKRPGGAKSIPVTTIVLDHETRWFDDYIYPSYDEPDPIDKVVAAVTREMSKEEIVALLQRPGLSERSIEDYLTRAVKASRLERTGRGRYAPVAGKE